VAVEGRKRSFVAFGEIGLKNGVFCLNNVRRSEWDLQEVKLIAPEESWDIRPVKSLNVRRAWDRVDQPKE